MCVQYHLTTGRRLIGSPPTLHTPKAASLPSLLRSNCMCRDAEMDHSSSSFANLPPQDLAGEAVHLVSVSDTVPQPYHHNHNHVSSTTPKPDPDPTLAGEDAHSLQPLQSAVGDLTAYTHDHSNGIMGVPDAYHSLLVRATGFPIIIYKRA